MFANEKTQMKQRFAGDVSDNYRRPGSRASAQNSEAELSPMVSEALGVLAGLEAAY